MTRGVDLEVVGPSAGGTVRAAPRNLAPRTGVTTRLSRGRSRPAPALWLPSISSVLPADGHMRGREIPGSWPDLVPILSRSGCVSRQVPELCPAGPSTRPRVPHHE